MKSDERIVMARVRVRELRGPGGAPGVSPANSEDGGGADEAPGGQARLPRPVRFTAREGPYETALGWLGSENRKSSIRGFFDYRPLCTSMYA